MSSSVKVGFLHGSGASILNVALIAIFCAASLICITIICYLRYAAKQAEHQADNDTERLYVRTPYLYSNYGTRAGRHESGHDGTDVFCYRVM